MASALRRWWRRRIISAWEMAIPGPNTGGMGAYSTADIVDDQMRDWLVNHIARPVVAGMKAEGAEFKGVLYCGLMMTARGPMVLEFNCRFGDPETQPILMRLESDLVDALEASIEGRVSEGDFKWSTDASVCVVMSSGGYPGTFEVGKRIDGLDEAAAVDRSEGVSCRDFKARWGVLHCWRARAGRDSAGADLETAVERAYEACGKIRFEGAHYRRDIAGRALKKGLGNLKSRKRGETWRHPIGSRGGNSSSGQGRNRRERDPSTPRSG